MTTNKNWRHNFGIVRDNVKYVSNPEMKEKVADVRRQARDKGYKGINTATQQELERYAANNWGTTKAKITSSLIRHAKGFIVITYSFQSVTKEVDYAIRNNTPVWVLNTNHSTELLHPTSLKEWYNICNAVKTEFKSDKKFEEYQATLKELGYALASIMRESCTWLGSEYTTLYKLYKKFPSFEAFMSYVSGTIEQIKEEGEWDVRPLDSLILNPRASLYVTQDAKGRTTLGCNEHFDFWENYEVQPADVLQEFLSLTYYKANNIKPLQRVMTDGEDMYVYKKGETLVTTPLYVSEDTLTEEQYAVADVDADVYNVIYNQVGVETIKRLGYEEALKCIRYNLTHK